MKNTKNNAENSKAGRTATELHTFNAMVKETVDDIISVVRDQGEGLDDFDITDKVLSDFTAFDNNLTFEPDLAKEVGCFINEALDCIEQTVSPKSINKKTMDTLRWVRSRLAMAYAMSVAYEDWMNLDDDNTGLWDETCDGVADALSGIYPKEETKEKLTFKDVYEMCFAHNDKNNVGGQYGDKNPLWFVAVLKDGRKYRFRSDNKRFVRKCIGTSVFAKNVEDEEDSVRLDYDYSFIDYCYQE